MKRIRALRIIIFPAIFTLIGGTCGWLYFRFAGCASGACAIASSPWLTVLFGAAVGLMLGAVLQPHEKDDAGKTE